MRKLVVSEFIALDGVIEAPETWHFPFISDDAQAYTMAQIDAAESMLYGRVTYDIFAGYWPNADQNDPIAKKLNRAPKYVVSNTLKKADWQNTTIISGDMADGVAKAKAGGSGIMSITGSAALIQSLLKAGLVDELHLMVHPVIVGRGSRLFEDGLDSIPLKLVETQTFKLGVVALTYQVERKA
ncbi:MAG: dihydrofolate reductase family protein [Anaerolineae bacterium]|nr:dihydrofolate reductase family protein [Anaerolineae bacterium]